MTKNQKLFLTLNQSDFSFSFESSSLLPVSYKSTKQNEYDFIFLFMFMDTLTFSPNINQTSHFDPVLKLCFQIKCDVMLMKSRTVLRYLIVKRVNMILFLLIIQFYLTGGWFSRFTWTSPLKHDTHQVFIMRQDQKQNKGNTDLTDIQSSSIKIKCKARERWV